MRALRRREGGVALTETAIILPLLLLLVIGMLEAGFALRDSNVLTRATQRAARSDARVADQDNADYEALRALNSGLAGLTASSVQRVIIYDARATGDQPPATCIGLPRPDDFSVVGNSLCNVYSPSQVAVDQPMAFGCGIGAWDANFCPSDRDRSGDDADRIGVWVELSYDKVTSVLPGSLTLDRASVYQLEPCVAGDTTC